MNAGWIAISVAGQDQLSDATKVPIRRVPPCRRSERPVLSVLLRVGLGAVDGSDHGIFRTGAASTLERRGSAADPERSVRQSRPPTSRPCRNHRVARRIRSRRVGCLPDPGSPRPHRSPPQCRSKAHHQIGKPAHSRRRGLHRMATDQAQARTSITPQEVRTLARATCLRCAPAGE